MAHHGACGGSPPARRSATPLQLAGRQPVAGHRRRPLPPLPPLPLPSTLAATTGGAAPTWHTLAVTVAAGGAMSRHRWCNGRTPPHHEKRRHPRRWHRRGGRAARHASAASLERWRQNASAVVLQQVRRERGAIYGASACGGRSRAAQPLFRHSAGRLRQCWCAPIRRSRVPWRIASSAGHPTAGATR